MKKILLKGPDLPNSSNRHDLMDIYNKNKIKRYLKSSHEPNEIFIHAHGSEHFQENLPSQLSLALFNVKDESNFSEQLAHNVLTKIVRNTIGDKPNIVHIQSCHSGAAQHNLKDIDGNIVLCTYIPATNRSIESIEIILLDKHLNSKNLSEFIVNNLPLLSAVNFTVSYKLNDSIQTLNFDHSAIKTMDMNSFPKFLQEQYQKVTEFYKLQS